MLGGFGLQASGFGKGILEGLGLRSSGFRKILPEPEA
jgi:hypothetical protein